MAWFFATLAAEALDLCTVIELQLSVELLDTFMAKDLALREVIVNVPFVGEQIWFAPETFAILNKQAHFSPYREDA